MSSRATVKRGGTWEVDFVCKNADGSRMNLTGATVEYRVTTMDRLQLLVGLSNGAAGGITLTDAVNGEGTAKVERAETLAIGAGLYRHEVFVVLADGYADPIISGILEVDDSLSAAHPVLS